MTSPLDPQIRVLQHVPRWVIIRSLRQQSVAEHSYYVAIYATYIAKLLHLRQEDINWITNYALTHDFEEMVSGDIPTPFKRQLMLKDNAIFKASTKRAEQLQSNTSSNIKYCKEVVKVADLFEACMYLSDEKEMGNSTILKLWGTMILKLQKAAKNLDDDICKVLLRKIYQTPRTDLY